MERVYALIHSPLVGPLTWSLVAEHLRRRGNEVRVPALEEDDGGVGAPYWRQHAASAADGLAGIPAARALILVAHSGAGALLPAVRAALGRPVAAYVLVDAGLPHAGRSRLDAMRAEVPALAAELRAHLETGGRFPDWSDADLRDEVPQAGLRRRLLADLRPRPLAFFAEPLPPDGTWPDAPCGYIRLSPAYDAPAAQARRAGWVSRSFEAGHFHMLADPGAVAATLAELADALAP
jgi:hypothetical protein